MAKIATGGMINVYAALAGSDVDTDLDGVMDGCDNCPDVENAKLVEPRGDNL